MYRPYQTRKVRLTAGGRVHLGLVDMSGFTGRIFGGIGCIVADPRVTLEAVRSDRTEVVGDLSPELVQAIKRRLIAFVARHGCAPVHINVTNPLPKHSGFGSFTATCLAALQATASINDLGLPIDQLVRASSRGGASGIGIHGFARGGWIVDAGRPADAPPLPSDFQEPSEPSLLTMTIQPPPWTIGLFLPQGDHVSGELEQTMFRKTAIPRIETLEALAALHHGLVPALLEQDIQHFARALTAYQSLAFKAVEIDHQPDSVKALIDALRQEDVAVGMSSFGPLTVAFANNPADWEALAYRTECRLWETQVADSGWTLEWLN